MFIMPKLNGKLRTINNLSSGDNHLVNTGIPQGVGILRFESFDLLFETIHHYQQGTWLWKEDQTDTFRHVPLADCVHFLFGFEWALHLFICLFTFFGLVTAPRLFNYLAKVLHWIIICFGLHSVWHYMDNSFDASHPVPEGYCHALLPLITFQFTFLGLGVKISLAKQILPTHVTKILGIEVDTMSLTAYLGPEKLVHALFQIRTIIKR